MITFRCTKRVIERFHLQIVDEALASTGILGDWYANLLNVGSQRFVLCVSARALLPVILPARRDSFPSRFCDHLRGVLETLAISSDQIAAELASTADVAFARTRSRQVLGVMNDFAFMAAFLMSQANPPCTVEEARLQLAGTPYGLLGHDHPDRVARALFRGGSIA